MIIMRIKGDLGNQMFQYAAGRNLSLKQGFRWFWTAGITGLRMNMVMAWTSLRCRTHRLKTRCCRRIGPTARLLAHYREY